MLASNYSNTDSTENTVKMLLERSDINVNLQNKVGLLLCWLRIIVILIVQKIL